MVSAVGTIMWYGMIVVAGILFIIALVNAVKLAKGDKDSQNILLGTLAGFVLVVIALWLTRDVVKGTNGEIFAWMDTLLSSIFGGEHGDLLTSPVTGGGE